MDEKRLTFPCTKDCLVYACCDKLCMKYRDYVEESYRQQKYHCFKIVPPPPKQIQELSELMNRVEDKNFRVQYYPGQDVLIISHLPEEVLVAVIPNIRKKKDIMSYPTFPKELKGENLGNPKNTR